MCSLERLILSSNGGATLMDQTYTRNGKGMVTAIASPDASRSWAYGYDALDRLITADSAFRPVAQPAPTGLQLPEALKATG